MLVLLLAWHLPGLSATPPPDYDALATEKRLQVIDQVKGMLADPAHAERRPQLLHRLAELTAAQARELELVARGRRQQEQERCFDIEGCDVEAVPLSRGFEDWYRTAERAYAALEREPRFDQAPEAAWAHAQVLSVLARHDEARQVWTRIVKLHPASPEAPLAWVQLGDTFFDEGSAVKALSAYRRAQVEGSPVADYARHRVAWCQYNLGELDAAITTLQGLATGSGDLADQALDDLGRFFADADRLDDARAFFTRMGQPQRVRKVWVQVADRAEHNGQVDAAIQAWRGLILEDPVAAEVPGFRGRIVEALRASGKADSAVSEVETWLASTGPGSPWAAENPSEVDGARRGARKALSRLATEAHARSRQLARGDHLDAEVHQDLASRAYVAVLEAFPDGPDADVLRFAQAELYWEAGHFDAARAGYVAVVRSDPRGPNARFAAEAAVHAAEKGVGSADGGPFSDADAALVEACDLLVATFPDHARVPDALYKSGHLLYRRGRVVDAADRFEAVIARNPGSREAQYAAHLVLDGLAVAEDWTELERRAGFFADQGRLGSRAFRAEARDIEARAGFKRLEVLAGSAPEAAGEGMLAWAERFAEHPERALALNNAGVWLARAGRLEDAVGARQQLVAEHPGSEWVQPALAAVAAAHESVVRYPQAAEAYEVLVDRWSDAPSERVTAEAVADAAHSAAVLWGALGESVRARRAYAVFVDAFGDDPRTPDARLSIARLLTEEGRHLDAADAYAAFVDDPRSAEPSYVFFARVHRGRALEAAGRTTEAARVYEDTAARYRAHLDGGGVGGAYTAFAAEALFRLAEPRFTEFAAIELIGRDAKSPRHEEQLVRQATRDKVRALEQTKQAYGEVVDMGAGEWGLRAIVKVGEAHEEMARALRAAPCLKRLTEAQCELARLDQEDLAYLNESKSAEAYQRVLERASALGWTDDAVVFAAARLSALRPEALPPLHEEGLAPVLSGGHTTRPEPEDSL